MPRANAVSSDRTWAPLAAYVAWATAALLPLALLACSDSGEKTRTETAGASPDVVESVEPATGSPEAIGTASEAIVAVSYEDAERVFEQGDYDTAAELFEAYTERKPDNPWGHYMLGLASYRSGDLVGAESAFDRAIELDPSHVKSYVNSARVLIDLGRGHEAVERATIALEKDTTSSDALRLLARAQASVGSAEDAIGTYRRALVLDDRDVWAMNNLGLLLIEQGCPEQALAPLARAVQLRSTAPVFQNNLGVALERTGHLAQAAEAYGSALRADSTYAKAGISLERVQALIDPSVVDTVDLDELAESFRLQIRTWSETEDDTVPEAPAVEVSPVEGEDSVTSDAVADTTGM